MEISNLKYFVSYPYHAIKEIYRISRYKSGIDHARYLPLSKYRGIHHGKRCFIVGNGPSLNSHDLYKLKNEFVFLFNGAYELREKFALKNSMEVVEDVLVMQDHIETLNSLDFPVFIADHLSKFISNPEIIKVPFSQAYPEFLSNWPPFVNLNADKPIFYWGGTVAYMGLQLAVYMGFEKIYLIGVDLTYTISDSVIKKGLVLESTEDDDPNHYSKTYFGKGRKWHVPQPERMHRAFHRAAKIPGLKIRNAGIGGRLTAFPKVDYDSLF